MMSSVGTFTRLGGWLKKMSSAIVRKLMSVVLTDDCVCTAEDRPALRPYTKSSAIHPCAGGPQTGEETSEFAFLIEYTNSRAEYNREIGKLMQQEEIEAINIEA